MRDWAASRLNKEGGHMTSTGVLGLHAPTSSGERAECGKERSISQMYGPSIWESLA